MVLWPKTDIFITNAMADSSTLPGIFRGFQFLLSLLIRTHKVMIIVSTSSPALRCTYILFLNRDSKHLGLRLKLILSKVQEKRFGQVDNEEMLCLLLILIHTYGADQSVDNTLSVKS